MITNENHADDDYQYNEGNDDGVQIQTVQRNCPTENACQQLRSSTPNRVREQVAVLCRPKTKLTCVQRPAKRSFASPTILAPSFAVLLRMFLPARVTMFLRKKIIRQAAGQDVARTRASWDGVGRGNGGPERARAGCIRMSYMAVVIWL